MDPITVTIVTALSSGAVAAAKDVATQAIKDAYAGLKKLVVDRYKKAGPFVEALEAEPDSKATQEVLAKQLQGVEADPQAKDKAVELIDLVLALQKQLAASKPSGAAALFDVKKLNAAKKFEIKGAYFTGGLVKGEEWTVGDDISLTDLHQSGSGETPPK